LKPLESHVRDTDNSSGETRNILDCDKSTVLLARIIFSYILLSAISFFSVCIRDLASILDPSVIILIVTGVKIGIKNCLSKLREILSDFTN